MPSSSSTTSKPPGIAATALAPRMGSVLTLTAPEVEPKRHGPLTLARAAAP
jgi:hypothetical protein